MNTKANSSMWRRAARPFYRGTSRWRQFHQDSASQRGADDLPEDSAQSHRRRWSSGLRSRR